MKCRYEIGIRVKRQVWVKDYTVLYITHITHHSETSAPPQLQSAEVLYMHTDKCMFNLLL